MYTQLAPNYRVFDNSSSNVVSGYHAIRELWKTWEARRWLVEVQWLEFGGRIFVMDSWAFSLPSGIFFHISFWSFNPLEKRKITIGEFLGITGN